MLYYYLGSECDTNKQKIIEAIETLSFGIEKSTEPLDTIKSNIPHDLCRGIVSIPKLKENINKYITLYIKDDTTNEIVGLVIFEINRNNIEIDFLCTKSNAGKGNGSLLVNIVKEFSKNFGIPKIKLTPVQLKDEIENKAIAFYEKEGFIKNGIEYVFMVSGGFAKRKITTKRARKPRRKSVKRNKNMKL